MDNCGGGLAPPVLHHLPPLSPRSAAKSFFSALTGRYSASYTVTPRSSRHSAPKSAKIKNDSFDNCVIRSKSYTPVRQLSDPSTNNLSFPVSTPRRISSDCSDSSLHSWGISATSRSLPPSPSLSHKSILRPSSPESGCYPHYRRSSSYSHSHSHGNSFDSSSSSVGKPATTSTDSWKDDFFEDYIDNDTSFEAVPYPSFLSSEDKRRYSSSLPPNPKKSHDDEVRRSGLEEWILCTVKRSHNNRVNTMTNKTLKDNIEQYQTWLRDSPSATKAARLTKSRNSFRFGKNKGSGGSRSSTSPGGKTVAVRGHSSVEELKDKQGEVLRLLDFYENAIKKKIPDYLVGLATMILENVIHLSRDVDQMVPNTNSSEASSLVARLNQSIADLVLWNDQFHLYGDDSHNKQQINTIVTNVRQAVEALVEFAINKENQNECNEFFAGSSPHNESNGSLCSDGSPLAQKKKLNGTRNSLIHGSMPEIFHPNVPPPKSTSSRSPIPPPLTPTSAKLAHSVSSDSILDAKEAVLPNKPPIIIGGYETSWDNLAPPIPPKKGGKQRHSSVSELECNHLIGRDTTDSQRLSVGSSTPSQVSPATSHDSMNPPHSHGDTSTPIRGSFEDPRYVPFDLTMAMGQNIGISPLRPFNDHSSFSSPESSIFNTPSNNISINGNVKTSSKSSFISHTVHHISQNESMRSITTTSSSQVLYPSAANGQHHVMHRSSRSSTCSSSSRSSGSEGDSNSISMNVAPPIPKKKGRAPPFGEDRTQSQYDNVLSDSGVSDIVDYRHTPPFMVKNELNRVQGLSTISSSTTSSSGLGSSKSSMTSSCEGGGGGSPLCGSVVQRGLRHSVYAEIGERPPLPIKKKHVMEYMKTFKDYEMPEKEWFSDRRSQQMITSHHMYSANYLSDEFRDLDFETLNTSSRLSLPATSFHLPPALPPKRKSKEFIHERNESENSVECDTNVICPCQQQAKETYQTFISSAPLVIEDPATKEVKSRSPEPEVPPPVVEEKVEEEEPQLLDAIDVDEEIVFKNGSQESDVKAGSPDALLVFATYSKNGPYLEAFLTTYRTFLTPAEVIDKLLYRYHKFICSPSPEHQKAAKNAFSLLVRVVHDLVVPELSEELLRDLADFEYDLVAKGDLKLGLYFRKKLSEKLQLRKRHREQFEFQGHFVSLKEGQVQTLLDFKVQDVADQMTLLDSELFSKVGLPELLHFSRDQNEDQCPNLKVFAMQINNMSSWVETQILKSCAQDREKYYKKFIKIMKHLRKQNSNFNSCIAILSGLESAAVCRLDWPKTCTDTLKEYRDLFGFERSYRAYRQALAETKPPCIPHLGIILQDLTKLHNVNPNNTNGKVNFLKRWLQFNILEDMKRFIPSKYDLRRNEPIIQFINNFEDCMSEEDLWELSLTIKPQKKNV